MSIPNVEEQMDGAEAPLCPLCDQPMFLGDEVRVAYADGAVFLVHSDCVEEMTEEEE